MSWLARLVNVFRAGKVSDDIDRELAFHVAERADDLIADGASPEAARLEARRRLGNHTIQRENVREHDLIVWLESFVADVRGGVRALLKQPIFAITTILTLAIGIGANTVVFTLLHGLLLRSLPVTAPQELVRINLALDTDRAPGGVDYGMLKRIDELDRTFVGLSAWRNQSVAVAEPDGTLRTTEAALVTGNAFDLLGLPAAPGPAAHARRRRAGRPAGRVAGRAQRGLLARAIRTPIHRRSARPSGSPTSPSPWSASRPVRSTVRGRASSRRCTCRSTT